MLKYLDVLIGFAVVMSLGSMAIMVFTQLISKFCNLRGRNLSQGLGAMFVTLVPAEDQKKLKELADTVLKHPIISDDLNNGGLCKASSIRVEELLGILKKLATGNTSAAEIKEWVPGLEADVTKIKELADSARKVINSITGANFPKVDEALAGTMEVVLKHVQDTASDIVLNIQDAAVRAELWFTAMQDRAREWFAKNAQLSNFIAAAVLAGVCQLDSFDLLRRLSTDDNLRAAYVAAAGPVLKQAEDLTKQQEQAIGSAEIEKLPGANKEEKAALSKNPRPSDKASATKVLLDAATPRMGTIAAAYVSAYKQTDDRAKDCEAALNKMPDLTKEERAALMAGAPTANEAAVKELLTKRVETVADLFAQAAQSGDFQKAIEATKSVQKTITDVVKSVEEKTGASSKAGGIIMLPTMEERARLWKEGGFFHLFGIAFSIALLSLGAPYWFNLLKTLTNFRPTLAQAIEKEKEAVK